MTAPTLYLADTLALVPLSDALADAYAELIAANRDHLARWWISGARLGVEDIRAYVVQLDGDRARSRGEAFVIMEGERPVGSIDLHALRERHGFAEVGYWLARAAMGRGVMTRALQGFARYVFPAFRLHRLEILVDVENSASRAVAERCGFTLEAVLRERLGYGKRFGDAALYVRFAEFTP